MAALEGLLLAMVAVHSGATGNVLYIDHAEDNVLNTLRQ